MTRCLWRLINKRQAKYHGEEWGVPVHGDRKQFEYLMMEVTQCGIINDWKTGPETTIRDQVLKRLESIGGRLIEVPYTSNNHTRKVDRKLREKLSMPEYRRRRRQLTGMCPVVKAIEAHSGLTGLIAQKTVVAHGGMLDQFDAMRVSSLCDSTAKGKPDIELVDMPSRLRTIDDIMEATAKPIILDGDTGGLAEHFMYNVRTLERMGVSAVIIEDKKGLKKTVSLVPK